MTDTTQDRSRVTALQHLTLWISGALLTIGVFGFVPGVTTGLSAIAWAGEGSAAFLFGLVQVSALHNALHLALGAGALAAAGRSPAARKFLAAGGLTYFALAVYGWTVHRGWADWNFLPFNEAGSWLHLILAFVLVMSAAGAPGLTFNELNRRRRSKT